MLSKKIYYNYKSHIYYSQLDLLIIDTAPKLMTVRGLR